MVRQVIVWLGLMAVFAGVIALSVWGGRYASFVWLATCVIAIGYALWLAAELICSEFWKKP